LYYTASHSVGGHPVHRCTGPIWCTGAPDGHLQSVMLPDAVYYNFDLLMMSA